MFATILERIHPGNGIDADQVVVRVDNDGGTQVKANFVVQVDFPGCLHYAELVVFRDDDEKKCYDFITNLNNEAALKQALWTLVDCERHAINAEGVVT